MTDQTYIPNPIDPERETQPVGERHVFTAEEVSRILSANMRPYDPPDSPVFPGYYIEEIAKDLNNAAAAQPADGALRDLRDAGWMVAVHNDYRQDGQFKTGSSDEEALEQVRALAAQKEPVK